MAHLLQAAGQKSGNPFALIRALQVEGESQIEESIPILIQANRLLACGSRDPSEHPGAAENDALGGDAYASFNAFNRDQVVVVGEEEQLGGIEGVLCLAAHDVGEVGKEYATACP